MPFNATSHAAATLHQLTVPLLPRAPPTGVRVMEAPAYGEALAAAYSTMHRARSDNTHSRRQQVATTFAQFLGRLPSDLGKDFATATAHDVLVFLDAEWRPHHGRTRLLDGSTVASASGLGNAISALNTVLSVMGRRGEWDPFTNQGNPCESQVLRCEIFAMVTTMNYGTT